MKTIIQEFSIFQLVGGEAWNQPPHADVFVAAYLVSASLLLCIYAQRIILLGAENWKDCWKKL